MISENIFEMMNGHWVRWSDYRVENDYVLPAENATMTMYDAAAERYDMLCDAINYGRTLSKGGDAEEAVLAFTKRYGCIGWLCALPCDPDFHRETHTYLRYEGFISNGKVVPTKEYIACFFPLGSERLQSSVAELLGRGGIYNKVFSATYGEPISWTAAMFVQLYEHFCCVEAVADKSLNDTERNKARKKLDWQEILGCTFRTRLKSKLQTSIEPDSLRSLIFLTYVVVQGNEDASPLLKRCKHCGGLFYNGNSRSEFCSVKCRNHYNVLAFRERHKQS